MDRPKYGQWTCLTIGFFIFYFDLYFLKRVQNFIGLTAQDYHTNALEGCGYIWYPNPCFAKSKKSCKLPERLAVEKNI
jgi:hypothetical protein